MEHKDMRMLTEMARGARPAELVLKNAVYLNVFTNEFLSGDIALAGGRIVGIGTYSGLKEIDLTGKTVVPGFIDSHVHLESAVVSPAEYARTVIPHGTSAVAADPHEIVNVLGEAGMEYMLRFAEMEEMDIFLNVPSCVPATSFDESGATFSSEEIRKYLPLEKVLGLGEMMNYPGVLFGDSEVLEKISAAKACEKVVDGHAPSLSGNDLTAYTAAGITSDHESTELEEALEKMRLGQWIMIREGTSCKNLRALAPLLLDERYAQRCTLATDDKHPGELKKEGHIDHMIRMALAEGVKPEAAFRAASFNAALRFGLKEQGAVAPGFAADLVVLDDVRSVSVDSVYKKGKLVAERGTLKSDISVSIEKELSDRIHDTVHLDPVSAADFDTCGRERKVIGLVPGQILTTDEGCAETADPERDLVKICVAERHKNTGHMGLAFLKGYGLRRGAVATSVAHDSHNIIAAGACDEDLAFAVNRLRELRGGMVAVENGVVLAELALPIAGLMSELSAEEVQAAMDQVKAAAADLGVNAEIDPLMTLSFVSLPVIPALRLTTRGAFDVLKFELV